MKKVVFTKEAKVIKELVEFIRCGMRNNIIVNGRLIADLVTELEQYCNRLNVPYNAAIQKTVEFLCY